MRILSTILVAGLAVCAWASRPSFQAELDITNSVINTEFSSYQISGDVYDASVLGYMGTDISTGDLVFVENVYGDVDAWEVTNIVSAAAVSVVLDVEYTEDGTSTLGVVVSTAAICTMSTNNATFPQQPSVSGARVSQHMLNEIRNYSMRLIDAYTVAEADALLLAKADISGDTFTGRVYTSIDYTTAAPASTEFAPASWVRSLTIGGAAWYYTSTVTNPAWAKTTNFFELSTQIGTTFTNSIASPIVSDTYLAGGIVAQLYGSIRSPITFEVYMNRNGGNNSTVIPVHMEAYYVYNGATNHLGDWEVANQTITATTPTKYTYSVAFVEPTITGSVYIVSYIKSGTVSGNAAGLDIFGGTLYPSRMDIDAINAGETAADVAADLLLVDARLGVVESNYVISVNSLTGAVQVVGRTNVTVTAVGSNIYIDADSSGSGDASAWYTYAQSGLVFRTYTVTNSIVVTQSANTNEYVAGVCTNLNG